MARPIWNGMISFGLLNVPVELHSGERTVDLHLRMLDGRDNSPIRYERINTETGEEVPWQEIVKAYEYSKGSYVVIDEKELRRAHPEATETVEIKAFVDRDAIDPPYFEKPYYLVPAKKAEKGYVLLREVLKKTGKVGIATVVIRTRQYLAAIMPLDNALLLNLMRFPQELIPANDFEFPDASPAKYRVSAEEMKMANALVESMVGPWNPTEYKDDFRSKLRELIDARVSAKQKRGKKTKTAAPEKPQASSNVIDFMSLLKKSVAKKQSQSTRHVPKPRGGKHRKSS